MYRLDAVNEHGKPVGAPAAYTELVADGAESLAADVKPGSSVEAVLVMLTRLLEKDHQARAEERRQDRELLRQALVQNHETIRAVVVRNVELTAPRLNEPTLKTVDQIADRVRQEAAATEARRNAAPATPEPPATDPWVGLLMPVVRPVLSPLMEVAAQEVTMWKERRRQAHDARLGRSPAPRNASAAPAAAIAPSASAAAVPVAPSAPRVAASAPAPAVDLSQGSYAYDLEPFDDDDDDDQSGEHETDDLDDAGEVDAGEIDAVDDEECGPSVTTAAPSPPSPPPSASGSADRDHDDDAEARAMLGMALSAIGVPAPEVDVIADRLDAVLDRLPAEHLDSLGALLTRASESELAIVRELLAPVARMSRDEAIAYATHTLFPAIAKHMGATAPASEV
jgi:hypothetical protein